MKPNYSISIPKPCHEDWSKMTPNEKGRFCKSCSKTVVDFTKMDTKTIQDYINNRNHRICGHIKQSQLDTINLRIPETVFSQNLSFQKLFLLTLLLVMGTTLFNCSSDNGIKKNIETVEIVERTFDSTLTESREYKDSLTTTKIKNKDSVKVKKPNTNAPPTPIIIKGDIVTVVGALEPSVHSNKQPFAYNYVDEKPKFPNTPPDLSEADKRAYFHKKISKIFDENFKIEQDTLGLKGKQRMYCQFEINKNGDLDNLKIRAPHLVYEEEAKRVFGLFPKFTPAKHNGKNVSVVFTLPIVYMIED